MIADPAPRVAPCVWWTASFTKAVSEKAEFACPFRTLFYS